MKNIKTDRMGKRLPSTIDITIKPVANMEGDFIAFYHSDFLNCTYMAYFKDNIYGALALNSFYEMLKNSYGKEIEFFISEQEYTFKNPALLDLLKSKEGVVT